MLTRGIVIRWLARAVLGFGAATLLWRSRIIQVATFLAAAGLRGRHRAQEATGPAGRSSEWFAAPPLTTALTPLNPLALVTYHPEYHAFDPRRAIASLTAITRLGVGWVRTDIRWREILPDGMRSDPRAVAWYRAFLGAASARGLKSMVVLSTPPKTLLRQGSSEMLESWNRFVETVAAELGTQCDVYQLMNEPNNPVYRFFSLQEAATALVQGAAIIHSSNKEAKVAINVAMEIWGWRKYLTEILRLSGRSIDIVGLDHYPGTWTVGWQDRWADVSEIADVIASAPRGSPWFDRRLAIMETGFSTNALMRDQRHQSEYFENAMRVASYLKRRSVGGGILLGIYELCDGDSSAWLDPEAHFGLLTSDLQPKRAFATVMQMVASL